MDPGTFFRSHWMMGPLGVGGMSRVDLGFDCRRFRFVAVKTLLERFAGEPSAVSRLRREADIYRRLVHPAIVGFVESGVETGVPFVVQEYLRGDSLRKVMAAFPGGLPFQAAIPLVTDLAEGLSAAHNAGIIHRDVQPDNVVVSHEGAARLFDFGIAWADDDLVQTAQGTIMGTVVYSAPEQNRGETVDERADVYSLGAILFELLTARRLVEGRTLDEVLLAQEEEPASVRDVDPAIPGALDAIVRRMTARDPDARYGSMRDVLVDLGSLRLRATGEELERLYGHPFFRALREARRAMAEGRVEEAYEQGRDLETRYKDYQIDDLSRVYHLLGRACAALGRHDPSARYFERALFADPGNVDYALDFAVELVKEKRGPRALGVLRTILAEDPGDLLAKGLADLLARGEDMPVFTDDGSGPGGLGRWFRGLWGRT